MFERFTEKARRVIFFARYEASTYGCEYIETEHILLGVMRESRGLLLQVLGPNADEKRVREEVEKVIAKGKSFSRSVEVPLTKESKEVLKLSAEEATRMGSHYVGAEHILLGLLLQNGSGAARILKEMGGKLGPMREQVAKLPGSAPAGMNPRPTREPVAELYRFLASLTSKENGELGFLFAKNALIVDATGKRWKGRGEIAEEYRRILVDYARKDVTSQLESVETGPDHTLVASVLWENVIVEGGQAKSTHRMTIILGQEGEEWAVFLLQVTPVVNP
jgi:hypothetical protein